jgi:hypothetical protein
LLHIIQKIVSFVFVHPPNENNTTATTVIHHNLHVNRFVLAEKHHYILCRVGGVEGDGLLAHSMERTTKSRKNITIMQGGGSGGRWIACSLNGEDNKIPPKKFMVYVGINTIYNLQLPLCLQ